MADRSAQALAFLDQSGWGEASRSPLAGDASARRYERLRLGKRRAVFMDAPPGLGDDVSDFHRIALHLLGLGLSAPEILAANETQGFLLLEDLGDGLFAKLAANDSELEPQLYAAAVDVLLRIQSAPPPRGLPDLGPADWAEAADLAPDWYGFALTGTRREIAEFRSALTDAMAQHANGPRVMILRDYHAENLLWLPEREGTKRVGLLDFQLAQMAQPGYDLVSLCQDARRDVPPPVEQAMIRRFVTATNVDPDEFDAAYATLGAQRALRILGIFARLCLVSAKPGYVALIPRVWGQLQRNLAHPALSQLAKVCEGHLPEPSTDGLERIRAQCGQHAL